MRVCCSDDFDVDVPVAQEVERILAQRPIGAGDAQHSQSAAAAAAALLLHTHRVLTLLVLHAER